MTIRFLIEAQRELDDAFAWYETDRPGLGFEFLDAIDGAVRRISVHPEGSALLTRGLRRVLLRRFPYGLIYGRGGDTLVVVAVAHLHRRPRYWINRE